MCSNKNTHPLSDLTSLEYAQFGAEMTPPRNAAERLKRFLLRDVHDRFMPWWYTHTEHGIKCINFHYMFEHERNKSHDLFRTIKTLGEFISTKQLLELVSRKRPVKGRFYHLSIDDGFSNIATNAHPIFRDLDIPYTFFVCPTFVGGGPAAELEFMRMGQYAKPLPIVDWPTLRQLSQEGAEIGSHTRSHVNLASIHSNEQLRDEIIASKTDIERNMQSPCISFAWPFGRTTDIDDRGLAMCEEAEYQAVFGVVRGTVFPERPIGRFFPRHHFEPSWPTATTLYYLTRTDRK